VERCLDHSLAHRLTTVERVGDLVDALPARAVVGRRLLVALLEARSNGIGHRSRLEQRVARWLDAAGLGGWERNVRVAVSGGADIEVDFAWPSARVALEVSPFFTHGSRAAQERDAERRRLLVADGWGAIDATDTHLVDRESFDAIARSVRQALARAGAPAVRGPGTHPMSKRAA
jgi:very-short-patch-repair endonuclease